MAVVVDTRPAAGAGLPPLVLIGLGWTLSLAGEVSGVGHRLHHDALIHSGAPIWQTALLMLVAWQVMTAAMMIPAVLPVIDAVAAQAGGRGAPRRTVGAFVLAYFLAWTAFAAAAFIGDLGVHRLVHLSNWLAANSWVIASTTFGIAAAYQFAPAKHALLSACAPCNVAVTAGSEGATAGLAAGLRFGLRCVGACWALMLLMFAAGVGHLTYMALLSLVVVGERSAGRGHAVARASGAALMLLALASSGHPLGVNLL